MLTVLGDLSCIIVCIEANTEQKVRLSTTVVKEIVTKYKQLFNKLINYRVCNKSQ